MSPAFDRNEVLSIVENCGSDSARRSARRSGDSRAVVRDDNVGDLDSAPHECRQVVKLQELAFESTAEFLGCEVDARLVCRRGGRTA